jgi:hypothetical protein
MPVTIADTTISSSSTLSFKPSDGVERITLGSNRFNIGGTGATNNITASSYNRGQLTGFRNKIINGDMNIAQREASFVVTSSAFTLDRWYFANDSSVPNLVTVARSTDVPTGYNTPFNYSLRATVTTADATVGTEDYAFFQQMIEGYNARDLIGRTFTVSFWVRSAKTGTHSVFLRNYGPSGVTDRSHTKTYTVNNINTWEFKSVTFHGGLITAGTWNWTNGGGLYVGWALKSGTTYMTTPDAWQTGNFIAATGQVNVADTVGNIFAITGVQLEVGNISTYFEKRHPSTELILCERYYQVYSGLTGGNKITIKSYAPSAPGTYYIPGLLRTEMRANPNTSVIGFSLTQVSAFSVTAARNAFRYNITATVTGSTYLVDGTTSDSRIVFEAEI